MHDCLVHVDGFTFLLNLWSYVNPDSISHLDWKLGGDRVSHRHFTCDCSVDNEHRFYLRQRKFSLALLSGAWRAGWTRINRRGITARHVDGRGQRSVLCTSSNAGLVAVESVSHEGRSLIPFRASRNYSPDHKGEHPQAHLSKFTGTLQADGYAGFEQIYETGRIQEAACWAHVRRKFYDVQMAHKSPVAVEALERIGALYAVESDINGRFPEERREIRDARSRPLLRSLKQWLDETLVKLPRKSDTAMAVRYALGRWEELVRYCDDGHLEIDNNIAERSLRAVALGRKNCLFAGSNRGGESAAVIYSLIGTAKLNGIDPESYLRNVLSRIPDHPINRIEKLVPWNFNQ